MHPLSFLGSRRRKSSAVVCCCGCYYYRHLHPFLLMPKSTTFAMEKSVEDVPVEDLTPEEASRIIHSHRKVRYGKWQNSSSPVSCDPVSRFTPVDCDNPPKHPQRLVKPDQIRPRSLDTFYRYLPFSRCSSKCSRLVILALALFCASVSCLYIYSCVE